MKTVIEKLIEKLHPNFFTELEKEYWIKKESEQSLEYYKIGFDNAYSFILKNGMPDEILNENKK